jgi:hypothetical protein
MMTQQLRRWTDKVDGAMLRRWSDKASDGLKSTGEAAKSGITTVYTQAMNHPKTAVAVMLGAGVAAAILWIARRNGTYAAAHRNAVARVRRAPSRARHARASAK